MRGGSGINKGTDPEQSAKRVEEGRQGRRMRVQEISGKDVHNMKAQPLTLLPHKTRSKLSRSGQDLRGVQGGAFRLKQKHEEGGQGSRQSRGVWGGVQGVAGGVQGGSRTFGRKTAKSSATNIPPFDFKVLGGGNRG